MDSVDTLISLVKEYGECRAQEVHAVAWGNYPDLNATQVALDRVLNVAEFLRAKRDFLSIRNEQHCKANNQMFDQVKALKAEKNGLLQKIQDEKLRALQHVWNSDAHLRLNWNNDEEHYYRCCLAALAASAPTERRERADRGNLGGPIPGMPEWVQPALPDTLTDGQSVINI